MLSAGLECSDLFLFRWPIGHERHLVTDWVLLLMLLQGWPSSRLASVFGLSRAGRPFASSRYDVMLLQPPFCLQDLATNLQLIVMYTLNHMEHHKMSKANAIRLQSRLIAASL